MKMSRLSNSYETARWDNLKEGLDMHDNIQRACGMHDQIQTRLGSDPSTFSGTNQTNATQLEGRNPSAGGVITLRLSGTETAATKQATSACKIRAKQVSKLNTTRLEVWGS